MILSWLKVEADGHGLLVPLEGVEEIAASCAELVCNCNVYLVRDDLDHFSRGMLR